MNFDFETITNLGLTAATPQKSSGGDLGQDDFLKLLTTQLSNQDPFKPLESGEFLGQIAQFSTVSGIQNLEKSFADFASSLGSDQALQASNLIGRTVLVPETDGLLSAGGEIQGELSLSSDASSVAVSIFNTSGELVRTLNLGPRNAGQVPFNWDGLLADGTHSDPGEYIVQGSAEVFGENHELPTQIQHRVESVTIGTGTQGLKINLAGGDSVNFHQIRGIL